MGQPPVPLPCSLFNKKICVFCSSLSKSLCTRKGSRRGNAGNRLEFEILTRIQHVPWAKKYTINNWQTHQPQKWHKKSIQTTNPARIWSKLRRMSVTWCRHTNNQLTSKPKEIPVGVPFSRISNISRVCTCVSVENVFLVF
jgi:hypothetical protein